MSSFLVVPIHLDALCLVKPRYITEPMVDFTRLPYFDAKVGQDINPDTPYLSEAILSKPFQDQRLQLKAGIHLHWSLPDALTQAQHQDDVTVFPAVPNRWLVTRSRKTSDHFVVEQQWLVESDFLSDDNPGSVNYPYIAEQMSSGFQRPFRYLGRKVPLDTWQVVTSPDSYLTKLTAVGYGEPTFAAFYPNCHSIFGFHDPEYGTERPQDLRYDIVGWYANIEQDALHALLQPLTTGTPWQTAIQEVFSWTAQTDTLQPERLVCYAQITFEPSADADITNPKLVEAGTDTGVSVGNTATESLAAHLGSQIDGIVPDELEDLLEALQLADHLEEQRLDVGPKFREGRHEGTFRSLSPGKLWTIRRQDDNSEGANVVLAQRRERATLPSDLAQALDRLNQLQYAYDQAQQQLEDLRDQIFADWYKYMLCVYPPETSRESYPDIDEVMYFIQTKDIARLQSLENTIGKLPTSAIGNSLAHQLEQALDIVVGLLEETNRSLTAENGRSQMSLQEVAAPRYYLPKEPVVLFTGDAATPSDRHGQDGRLHPEGLLQCQVTGAVVDSTFSSAAAVQAVREIVVPLFANFTETSSIAVNTWRHQPWHPILLQWEVEFFPTREGNNLSPENRSYQGDFIRQNYTLAEQEVELQLQPGKIPPDKAANVYSGTTILSPAAQPMLSERILIYLEKHLLAEYYQAQNIPEADQVPGYFRDRLTQILDWYKNHGSNTKFQTLIRVYEHLQQDSGNNLSQALGGFNDALLMHKVTRQIPIADPIGFEPYRSFSEQDVRHAVGRRMIRAPQPLNDFNPIRAGALKLLRLRLIDNFGVVHDVNVNNMTTTQQLRVEGYPDWVAMPPRLTQPARLNFRWLAAEEGVQETNSHPDTTPICGWLLPNNLDDSLAVYDRTGRALGSLYALSDPQNAALAQWRSAPGRESVVAIADLPDPHLSKAIAYIQGRGAAFLGNFLSAINTALAGIDPESYSQHRSQALLMGRPVAVVRASVDLQLLGLPAINQAWNVFRQDLHRSRRETNDFTKVLFPIRIGEYHQLNDGLVGYWVENAAGQIDSPFYAAQSEPNESNDIVTYHGEPIFIEQAIDAPPHYLTMLVDPCGVVHATSGILPTKAISIPADQYRQALSNIEITFFSAPILSDANQLDLPLPREAGYLWSWLQRSNNQWTEISTLRSIRRSVFVAAIGEGGDSLWQGLIQQGWLTVLDDETALVVADDQRPNLSQEMAPQRTQIEQILDHPTVDPARLEAHFLSQPTVREGWLKLRKSPTGNEQNA
ncbi:hypothetical protein [Cylindrospermum sp. FACHB-282]|uniref:hypothetical protein n=1 Tax=Cylindrospermum sp. FACHB-282 TaxID=2692794 RepID=UPI0016883DEE|nr:hypothetical protein [Cylindrospermum sp. FACHB-282]MBD2385019.1 hypothetical protein [Cylindrospermum sp. FACHB-282]